MNVLIMFLIPSLYYLLQKKKKKKKKIKKNNIIKIKWFLKWEIK